MKNVKEICREIEKRLNDVHIGCFKGKCAPLLLISETYPGIWLEHVYDSVFYAQMDHSKLPLAENTVKLFLQHQKEDGQLPCYVWDGARINLPEKDLIGYGQIQECVSFASLAYQVYRMNHDRAFLEEIYAACKKWENWLREFRMTRNLGLVEMFCGYDTGHDNSGRLAGISCPGNYQFNGKIMNAAVLPPEDGITPIVAVDMNCNFYATLKALEAMAKDLGHMEETREWKKRADVVKQKLFALCYNEDDGYFYDVDKQGNQRKYLSCTIFHLFMEGVLDPEADHALIGKIYHQYIANDHHFATPYPFPSMSVSDPSWKKHQDHNCWGYYSQGLIALRCTLWMDQYGYHADLDHLCRQFIRGWTACFDEFKLGQELDPITGQPSVSSEWYSSCMLMYLYCAKRLGLI